METKTGFYLEYISNKIEMIKSENKINKIWNKMLIRYHVKMQINRDSYNQEKNKILIWKSITKIDNTR